jgi:N-acetylglutamate synthase-like GNAT family acetyltransferase
MAVVRPLVIGHRPLVIAHAAFVIYRAARGCFTCAVSGPKITARRANVECLPALREFWASCGAPVELLEKRLTEFQIADADGVLLATAALHVSGKHGRIHSEYSVAGGEAAASLLRDRIKNLANNLALLRLWVASGDAGWRGAGFRPANEGELESLPKEFTGEASSWDTLKLRDEKNAAGVDEFVILRQQMQAESERLLARARVVKVVAYLFAFVVGLLVVLLVFAYFKYSRTKPAGRLMPSTAYARLIA